MYKNFPVRINSTTQTNEELFGEFDTEFKKMLVETGCENVVTYIHNGVDVTRVSTLVSNGIIPEYANYRSGTINDSTTPNNTTQVSATGSYIAYIACFIKNGVSFTFNIHRYLNSSNGSVLFCANTVANFNDEENYEDEANIFCKYSNVTNTSYTIMPPCDFDMSFIVSDELVLIHPYLSRDRVLFAFREDGNHIIESYSASPSSRNFMTVKRSKAQHNMFTVSSQPYTLITEGTLNGVDSEGFRYTTSPIMCVSGIYANTFPSSIKYLSGSFGTQSLLEIENELYFCYKSNPTMILKCGD